MMDNQGFRHPRGRFIFKIKEALKDRYVNRNVNLIGVVVEFSIPHHSRGTDDCSILKIIDETQQTLELSVSMFAENLVSLPHFRSAKDIIVLRNVGMKCSATPQSRYVVFHKSHSSFALFDGVNTDDVTPYQASADFLSADLEKNHIQRLRKWSRGFPLDLGVSDYVVLLKDVKEGEYIDLVCKVLHICEVSKGSWMLFVWDGTDAPVNSLPTKVGDEEEHPIPLSVEPVPLHESDLSNFHHIGTVLRVCVNKEYENFGTHFHNIGSWIRFRNLHCKQSSGLWMGVITRSTKVRLLSNEDDSVKKLLSDYLDRVRAHGRAPSSSHTMSGFLTATEHNKVKSATLLDLITLSKDYSKMKCIVRLLAICPSEVKHFRQQNGEYSIRLTLEDPTARIHAHLGDKDAVVFFGGYQTMEALSTMMNKLLGVPGCENSPRNPPWIELCMESFVYEGAAGSRAKLYNVCDTRYKASK